MDDRSMARKKGRTTHSQEEIRDVMRNIDGHPHVREMKAIAQPNQRQCNNMMPHQLLEILPRLLEQHTQHNRLLRPIRRLQQVISLEQPLVASMRVCLEHSRRAEIPHWSARHHVQAKRAKDREVQRCVDLFHMPVLHPSGAHSAPDGVFAEDAPLHHELAREGQNHDVEAHEEEVPRAFAVEGSLRR